VPFSLQPSANPMLPIDDTRLALHRPGLLDPYRHGEPPAWSVPGTELSLAAAWELACFAQSAYAPDEVIAARLERRGWELDLLRDRDGIRAFVALRGDGEGVVVFCGTRGDIFSNIVDDLDARWRPWGPGRVHRGFLRALDSAWPALASRLEPTRRWCFAGHSLGGALALLAALRRGGAAAVSFAAPRVGDPAFARGCAGLRLWRFVHVADAVVRQPPRLAGFVHAGRCCHLPADGGMWIDPPETRVARERLSATWRYALRMPWMRRGRVLIRSAADHAVPNYVARLASLTRGECPPVSTSGNGLRIRPAADTRPHDPRRSDADPARQPPR